MKLIFKLIFLFVLTSCSDSNQQPDFDFTPKNLKNSFFNKKSPLVLFDEAHNNLHKTDGRYRAFVQVLTSDGYTVEPSKEKFTLEYLKQADILVIVNAVDGHRQDYNPPFSDAFSVEEVEAVKQWVSQGGSLFFIADHMPYPKISEKLSSAFGFEFNNGHVGNAIFHIDNNSLTEHAITKAISDLSSDNTQEMFEGAFGQGKAQKAPHVESIVQVKSLGGSAFQAPEKAISLLTLGKRAFSLMPDVAFQVSPKTPRVSMEGWSQGAVLEFGKGRVAVFAEGTMFTSQKITSTGSKLGFTTPGAEQNEQFLLNVMHWLSKMI